MNERHWIPAIYARVRLGLGLARSCNNESDWLILGENTYPMIPGDGVKCTIPVVRSFHVSLVPCYSKIHDSNK